MLEGLSFSVLELMVPVVLCVIEELGVGKLEAEVDREEETGREIAEEVVEEYKEALEQYDCWVVRVAERRGSFGQTLKQVKMSVCFWQRQL